MDSKNRSILNEINRDLDHFLTTKTHEVEGILKKFLLKVFVRQCLKVLLAVVTFYAILCIPIIHENVCAIGRIAITTFASPAVNFETFSNQRCLIQAYSTDDQLSELEQSNENNYVDMSYSECGVCGNLGEMVFSSKLLL